MRWLNGWRPNGAKSNKTAPSCKRQVARFYLKLVTCRSKLFFLELGFSIQLQGVGVGITLSAAGEVSLGQEVGGAEGEVLVDVVADFHFVAA